MYVIHNYMKKRSENKDLLHPLYFSEDFSNIIISKQMLQKLHEFMKIHRSKMYKLAHGKKLCLYSITERLTFTSQRWLSNSTLIEFLIKNRYNTRDTNDLYQTD